MTGVAIGSTLAEIDLPQRSPFGHLWCSASSGAISGAVVVALGASVGPIRQVQGGVTLSEVLAALYLPVTYAVVVGAIIGIVAGLAILRQRGRFHDRRRRRTATILGMVVAMPGGVLLFAFWAVSTTSNVVFLLTMLGSVSYVGIGTYLAARVSLQFVLGAEHPDEWPSPHLRVSNNP